MVFSALLFFRHIFSFPYNCSTVAAVGRFSFLLFCHVLGIPRRDKFAGVGVDEIHVDIFRDIAAYDAVSLAAGGENKHRHRITNGGPPGLVVVFTVKLV